MLLDLTFRRLSVNVPGGAAALRGAQERASALRAFKSAAELLEHLNSGRKDADRLAVLAALISEQQRAAHPLWQVLLLHAFKSMLFNTRSLVKDANDDIDQRVLLGFLNAIVSLPSTIAPAAIPIAVQRALRKEVFKVDRHEQAKPRFDELDEELVA